MIYNYVCDALPIFSVFTLGVLSLGCIIGFIIGAYLEKRKIENEKYFKARERFEAKRFHSNLKAASSKVDVKKFQDTVRLMQHHKKGNKAIHPAGEYSDSDEEKGEYLVNRVKITINAQLKMKEAADRARIKKEITNQKDKNSIKKSVSFKKNSSEPNQPSKNNNINNNNNDILSKVDNKTMIPVEMNTNDDIITQSSDMKTKNETDHKKSNVHIQTDDHLLVSHNNNNNNKQISSDIKLNQDKETTNIHSNKHHKHHKISSHHTSPLTTPGSPVTTPPLTTTTTPTTTTTTDNATATASTAAESSLQATHKVPLHSSGRKQLLEPLHLRSSPLPSPLASSPSPLSSSSSLLTAHPGIFSNVSSPTLSSLMLEKDKDIFSPKPNNLITSPPNTMTSVIPSIPSSVTVVDREEQQQRRADGSGGRGEMRVRTRSEKLAEEMDLDIDAVRQMLSENDQAEGQMRHG
mmetsp:Transcript_51516/g.65968  ORF Transcript_51516/g.65968 Transcript_51516/m.65968 type:complete len:464 (+) Transcript_51516:50-1441(+)